MGRYSGMKPMDWILDAWDWFKEDGWIIFLILGILGITVWIVYVTTRQETASYQRFMDECLQDHKEYECEALWRSGKPKSEVIYIPMSTGGRR